VVRTLGIFEESAGYCQKIIIYNGYATITLRSKPIWYHVEIPIEAIVDKNTSIDSFQGKTISILRTHQGYLFKVLEEAVLNRNL